MAPTHMTWNSPHAKLKNNFRNFNPFSVLVRMTLLGVQSAVITDDQLGSSSQTFAMLYQPFK